MKRTLDNESKSLHNLLVKVKLQNITSGALYAQDTEEQGGSSVVKTKEAAQGGNAFQVQGALLESLSSDSD